ncbi:MAG: hypothetical protein U9N85_13650 [Bacteroidota bacterium]|nr:hypothetical protein [Bacteroidota bacterium]
MTAKSTVLVVLMLFIRIFAFSQHLTMHRSDDFLREEFIHNQGTGHISMRPFFVKDYLAFTDSMHQISESSEIYFKQATYTKQTKRSFFRLSPLFVSKSNYSLSDNNINYAHGVGIGIKANVNRKFFLDADLYGLYARLNASDKHFTDTFHVFPNFAQNFKRAGEKFLVYEADFRLTYLPADYIRFEVGKSRHFWGYGKQSLFLSDISASMPYFSTTVDVWQLKYRWMILRGNDFDLNNPDFSLSPPKKYFAIHYLSLNLGTRVNFNFFEALVTNPYDQKGKKGLDLNYLNPVIFYRPVEFAAGTYDNALFGLGLNIRLFKKLHLYSQLLIDDMIISELKAGNGWWGNKFGIQVGGKAYDFLDINNLYVSGELNFVRPFSYSHTRDNINYSNFRISLAHPEGSNFGEGLFIIRYKKNNLIYSGGFRLVHKGEDESEVSYGSNILRPYDLRPDNYNNKLLQGVHTKEYTIDVNAAWLLNPEIDLKLRAGVQYRKKKYPNFSEGGIQFYISFSTADIFFQNHWF